MKFGKYEFKDYIVKAMQDLQFKELTPVQERV